MWSPRLQALKEILSRDTISCELCSKEGFKSIIALQSHQRDTHKSSIDSSIYPCSLIDNSVSFSCGVCNRQFRTKFGLISHWQDSHKELFNINNPNVPCSYCCTICNRNINSLVGLLAHRRDAHAVEPLTEFCCPSSKVNSIIANAHLSDPTTDGSKPFIIPCNYCRRSFRAILDLRAHERDSHGIDIVHETSGDCTPDDTIPCSQCRRVFRTMFGLYTHQRDAHGLVPREISVCIHFLFLLASIVSHHY